MDETNPVYENFLNNMTRMSRTPKETTRKVSASKFLGIENLCDKSTEDLVSKSPP